MKISSKSILSPGHHRRDPPSSSAVRRLKPNRSLRGAQSPMFTSSKPRGTRPFENPEPSSPKVTCIGQVRVKARKKHNNNNNNNNNNRNLQKTLSQSRADVSLLQDRNRGEVSFRRVDKNQRWVHFPLTICEALSCLFPCRTPSCLSNGGRENVERERGCGAVLARWLVAVEGGSEKREIEDEEGERERGFRRHGVGEIEVEQQGRVSICVPPKNALLLMRCRSDPLRANALANRMWECPDPAEEEEDDDEGERESEPRRKDLIFLGKFDAYEKLGLKDCGDGEDGINPEKEIEDEGLEGDENGKIGEKDGEDEIGDESSCISSGYVEKTENLEIGDETSCFSSEFVEKTENLEMSDIQKLEIWEIGKLDILEKEKLGNEQTEETEIGETNELAIGKTEELEIGETEELGNEQTEELEFEKAMELLIEKTEGLDIVTTEELLIENKDELEIEITEELVVAAEKEVEDRRNSRYSCSSVVSLHLDIAEREEEEEPQFEEPETAEDEESEAEEERESEEEEPPVLPDCLLLMRYEPKLSMEVSKETWICSTDFIRWLPKRQPKPSNNKINGRDEPRKKRAVDPDAPLPPRSSCSFPAPPSESMAVLIEQRLTAAVAYEPFVLTRCKSEPMRTAAAKLVPESCFWMKERKLMEPHRSANFGVGAAGIGF